MEKKKRIVREVQEEKSFWEIIRTPLFYLGGGIMVIIVLGWIIGKFKEE